MALLPKQSFSNTEDAAKWLDEVLPGWAENVTKPVRQSAGATCVVGQNVGERRYVGWMKGKGILDWSADMPFHSVWSSNTFNEGWQAEVDKRRDPDRFSPPGGTERVTILSGNSVYEIDKTFDGLLDLLKFLDVELRSVEVVKR